MSPWVSFCSELTRLAWACSCSCCSNGSGGGGGGALGAIDADPAIVDQMAIKPIGGSGNARQTEQLLDRRHAIKAEPAHKRQRLIGAIEFDDGAAAGVADQHGKPRNERDPNAAPLAIIEDPGAGAGEIGERRHMLKAAKAKPRQAALGRVKNHVRVARLDRVGKIVADLHHPVGVVRGSAGAAGVSALGSGATNAAMVLSLVLALRDEPK